MEAGLAHVLGLVAAQDVPARYWPARQSEHVPVSAVGVHAVDAFWPPTQVAQVMHAVDVDVAPRRNCPISQFRQSPVFAESVHDVDAFLPAGHVAQGPEQSSVVLPSRPYRPAAHGPVQALEAEPPVPYFPFGQCMHSGAALPEYRPAIHAEQLLALAWENVPATQPLQLVAVELASLRYWPAAQFMQPPVSVDSVHAEEARFPAVHIEHAMHVVAVEVVSGRYWPPAQLEQLPVFADNVHAEAALVPAAHVEHRMQSLAEGPACVLAVAYRPLAQLPEHALVVDPPPPYFPAAQLLHDSAAAALYLPTAQEMHWLSAALPTWLLYLPASQLRQLTDDVDCWYFPVGQAVQPT